MTIIKNARIWPMTGQQAFIGDLAIAADGTLSAVGGDLLVGQGDTLIDAEGQWALPGFIDAHSHIGMWEDGMGDEGADGNEDSNPSTPALRAIDGVNPRDRCFQEALQAGITTVATGPGSANVIGGQFCALKTYGGSLDTMLARAPLAMKMALGENPKRVYGDAGKAPRTRMASAAIMRENLQKAKIYMDKKNAGGDKQPDYDPAMEMLGEVLAGRLRVKVHVHRADDIMTAIRVMKEFGLTYTLDHCTEGYLIPDAVRESGAMPILGPLICERSKIELRNLTMSAPARLWQEGLPFAIMTDHPVIPEQYLPVCAALAVREGCPEEAALQAITINAARAIGMDEQIGSLEVGKQADITLFDGHPLHFNTHVNAVFIGGVCRYQRA